MHQKKANVRVCRFAFQISWFKFSIVWSDSCCSRQLSSNCWRSKLVLRVLETWVAYRMMAKKINMQTVWPQKEQQHQHKQQPSTKKTTRTNWEETTSIQPLLEKFAKKQVCCGKIGSNWHPSGMGWSNSLCPQSSLFDAALQTHPGLWYQPD